MKLRPLDKNKDNWLQEFDTWITPYTEEIKDSAIFVNTSLGIKQAIELIGKSNEQFLTPDAVTPEQITKAVIDGIENLEKDKVPFVISSVFNLLQLVTGKSDNNLKCQFPVYLREILREKEYVTVNRNKLKNTVIPRTLSSETLAKTVASLSGHKKQQYDILLRYTRFILNEDLYIRSLFAIGKSFFLMKSQGTEDQFLLPLIVSFVRGSVSASGGHRPENLLRELMLTWGLTPGEDYNETDVIAYSSNDKNVKTRAYDFILPYNVEGWDYKIFIQSQFYAGDSGSVSHKNVDQMKGSREWIKSQHTGTPVFLEYVDGAGYYGSLNGDLKKMFHMVDTENFFQIRTSPIKLRQLLQEIGFLTPMEFVHSLSLSNFDVKGAIERLCNEGYTLDEVTRILSKSSELSLILEVHDMVTINEEFLVNARRYLLLDGIVWWSPKFRQV